jgi:hypothetical protein
MPDAGPYRHAQLVPKDPERKIDRGRPRLVSYHSIKSGLTVMHVILPKRYGFWRSKPERAVTVLGEGSWWTTCTLTVKDGSVWYHWTEKTVSAEDAAIYADLWARRFDMVETVACRHNLKDEP